MSKAWYEGLESPEEKRYEEMLQKVKAAVAQGLSFAQAASLLQGEDPELKAAVLQDALKVLIAEEHFQGQTPLEKLARRLRLPLRRLQEAKEQMLEEVKEEAIKRWRRESGGPWDSA
jgi:DNA-binding transcriptional MerR regulator